MAPSRSTPTWAPSRSNEAALDLPPPRHGSKCRSELMLQLRRNTGLAPFLLIHYENRRTSRRVPRFLRGQGLRSPAQRRAGAQRPDRPFHPRRHEPVQERVHGAGRSQLQAGRHLPEMPAHRRHRQRRPDVLPRNILRDAGEFQLRRLFQARGDPLGVGVLDAARSRSPPIS